MNHKQIIGITAIVMMLVLAGCGGEDKACPASCDDANPCTSDTCSKDTGYSCRNAPIPGCSLDCGMPCAGAAGQYMEMQCDPVTKSCASGPKLGLQIVPTVLTKDIPSMGNTLRAIVTYNQPFNAKKDTIDVKISMPQIGTGISDIKLSKIEISAVDASKQNVIIAEKSLNRYIWTNSFSVEESLVMGFPVSLNDGKFSTLKLTITYDYMQTSGSTQVAKTASVPITFTGSNFAWLNPSMTPQCPASCDDGNAGTDDKCSASTGFFCEHSPISGKCGNFICEPNENKCTCEDDCGPCSGDAGKYLTFLCQENECRTQLKPGSVQQPAVVTDDRNINILYLQNKYSYNNPFDITKDKFDLEFELYNKNDQVGSVKIVEARIVEAANELGSAAIGATLNTIGSKATASIPITVFAGHESEKVLAIKVYIEYQYTTTSGTELRKADFTKSLVGKITVINPTAK